MFNLLRCLSYVFSASPKLYFNLNDADDLAEPKKRRAGKSLSDKIPCLDSSLVEAIPLMIIGGLAVVVIMAIFSAFRKK